MNFPYEYVFIIIEPGYRNVIFFSLPVPSRRVQYRAKKCFCGISFNVLIFNDLQTAFYGIFSPPVHISLSHIYSFRQEFNIREEMVLKRNNK